MLEQLRGPRGRFGLHNNALNDTATYRGAMGGKGFADLKLDVDKRDKQAGAGAVDNIRRLIREKFGDKGVRETLDKEKITNIYRWCGSPDIERCHVGDPDHPDNVVWVTSEADFERLQKTGTNVVLESKEPKPPKSESAGDLSTMFVLLAIRVLDQWVRRADVASGILKAKMAKGLEDVARRLLLFEPQPEDAAAKAKQDAALFAAVAAMVRLETQLTKLRFVNIETEGKGWGKESERVANYRAIVAVFKDLDIHCCTVAGKGDAGVETPIPSRFMELQDVQELSNFFERRVSAFQVGITGSVEFDEAFLRRPRNSA